MVGSFKTGREARLIRREEHGRRLSGHRSLMDGGYFAFETKEKTGNTARSRGSRRQRYMPMKRRWSVMAMTAAGDDDHARGDEYGLQPSMLPSRFPTSSRQRRARVATSPSPSSPSSLSDSTFFSEMVWIVFTTSSDCAISWISRLSSDSSSCSNVQMAMCWKVESPLARKRRR